MTSAEELGNRLAELRSALESVDAERIELVTESAELVERIALLEADLARPATRPRGLPGWAKGVLGVFVVPLYGVFGAVSGLFLSMVVLLPLIAQDPDAAATWPLALFWACLGTGAVCGIWLAVRQIRRG